MIQTELSVVTVLLCGFGLWVYGVFVLSMRRSLSWRRQREATEKLLPEIREQLVDFLSGNEDRKRLRAFVQTSRDDSGAAVMSFKGTVAGSARERLCDLALELALVHDWCQETRSKNVMQRRTAFSRLSFVCCYEPCRRVAGDILLQALHDPDDEVKLSASRALVQSGGIDDAERVFEHAVSQNFLFRVLLTEGLRRHAVPLCDRAIPKVLQSGDPARILAALQMVAAWEAALPMPGIGGLLRAEDRRVRILALQVASLAPDAPEIRNGILEALADRDAEIAVCAARAAGRLGLESAVPVLARCLRTGDQEVAHAAAQALAEIPPRGWEALEELSSSPTRITALAASEALARVRRQT